MKNILEFSDVTQLDGEDRNIEAHIILLGRTNICLN